MTDAAAGGAQERTRTVFVVYGRNEPARVAVFAFLRSIGLDPIEWSQGLGLTGYGAPYIGEVLDVLLTEAQAVVVLMTPDDIAFLRPEYANGANDPGTLQLGQARPNVLFEAGLAMGRNPDRTVLVELGTLRPFSDVAGRHIVRLADSIASRQLLAQRLRTAGCPVNLTGTDWHTAGDFTEPPKPVSRRAGSTTSSVVSEVQGANAVSSRGERIVLSNWSVKDSGFGTYAVHGEATNTDRDEHSAMLKATFYDVDGKILGIANGTVNQLAASGTKTFSLMTTDDVADYEHLKVQVDAIM